MNLKSAQSTNSGQLAFRFLSKVLPTVFACILLLSLTAPAVFADGHTFDLHGPRIGMKVDRGGKGMPISGVTELLPGDRLWIHPEFPDNQSVHYLLVVAFLQGTTNPPPDNWFLRFETWNRQMREEGVVVTIPQGAEQAVLFLAPETGGDFGTLRSTVRSHPGVFVRAAQDLEEASLDRTRLDKYLDEITKTSNSDPADLKKNSTLLAQTLRIKVNEDCFSKPVEQQLSCLAQGSDQLVLDDSHDQSLVATLTSGPSSDLIANLGSSPVARGGYYSPYVGAIVDSVRLMGSLHTATYQYIPALGLPEKDMLNLRLNAPPSFRNTKSVIVVGLPSIGQNPLPVLHPVDPKQILCLQQSPLVLPVEGAPLMFSTGMGHDFTIRIEGKSGNPVNLPATPDAVRGGFVVDTHALQAASLNPELTATIHGYWGYAAFEGPSFPLRNAHSENWIIPSVDTVGILAGHPATLHLQGNCAACVEKVSLLDSHGKDLKPTWKTTAVDQLEIELPLKDASAGKLELAVAQYGQPKPDVVPLRAYSDEAHLEHFMLFSGDTYGALTGTHLDEVSCLELNGVCFMPSKRSQDAKEKTIELFAQNPPSSPIPPNAAGSARVTLNDGRTLDVQATIEPPRPRLSLVSKSVVPPASPSPIHFSNPEELPQGGKLSFFLKSEIPAEFPPTEKIEVATVNGSFSTLLSLTDCSLIQQDAGSVLAILDPGKGLGPAAFGPLHFRGVETDGATGDWQPLGILVRVPTLKEIHCSDTTEAPCTLIGSNLFLLDSVAADSKFKTAASVPEGYMSDSLPVPRPYGTRLYLKLRDDPANVATVALSVLPDDH